MSEPEVVAGGTRTTDRLTAKEHKILSGEPVHLIEVPGRKEPLAIWPKPAGYFYLIQDALQRYVTALQTYGFWIDDSGRPRLVRRFWQGRTRALRRYERKIEAWEEARLGALDHIGREKFRLLRLILEDRFHADRNVTLSQDEFLALPHDCFVRILDAYRDANDVDDILRRVIPGYGKDPQKKTLGQEIPAGATPV